MDKRVVVNNKLKVLALQVDKFIYNILPFEFYAKLVIHLQQQLTATGLKQQLYTKITEKLAKKSFRLKGSTASVLSTLVE